MSLGQGFRIDTNVSFAMYARDCGVENDLALNGKDIMDALIYSAASYDANIKLRLLNLGSKDDKVVEILILFIIAGATRPCCYAM